jgi:hypothetical protein
MMEAIVMRHRLIYASGLLVVGILTLSARTAIAQTTAVGPYYAPPAWDQKLQCDTLTTCPRFVVLSNWNSQAVLDRETGLVWERSPDPTPRNWDGALQHCLLRVVSDRFGWRLPSIQELLSLRAAASGSTLPPGHPFSSMDLPYYWSATSSPAGDFDFAWFSEFSFTSGGGVNAIRKSSSYGGAWCVRGGHGADEQ